jgi:hypothetical protein
MISTWGIEQDRRMGFEVFGYDHPALSSLHIFPTDLTIFMIHPF